MRRIPKSGLSFRLPAVLLVLVSLLVSGCGVRMHRPRDLQNARQAQASFKAAALGQTIEAERRRLDEVLQEELELVRKHTLARRDARLLYIIGEGDAAPESGPPGKKGAWEFLKDDIDERIRDLGFDRERFEATLKQLAQIPVRLNALEGKADGWNVVRANWNLVRKGQPQLPRVGCPLTQEQRLSDKALFDELKSTVAQSQRTQILAAELLYDDYARSCDLYLRANDIPFVNRDVIEKMRNARNEAEKAVEGSLQALNEAKRRFSEAIGTRQEETRRNEFLTAFNAVGGVAAQIKTKMSEAENALKPLGLDGVVSDLAARTTMAQLQFEREGVLAALSPEGNAASKMIDSLAAVRSSFEEPEPPSLNSLLIQEEQLRLDIQASEKRVAFFDTVLNLLMEQEEAYRTEFIHLGAAERHRQELETKKCLQPGENAGKPKVLEGLFSTSSVAQEECREIVFRLLVAYSNSWTLGRVREEEIDYRLISLHHQAALDSSEIAFAKWQSLLGLPIDQLVALQQTGLRTQDVIATIVNALGLGAIAAGVN